MLQFKRCEIQKGFRQLKRPWKSFKVSDQSVFHCAHTQTQTQTHRTIPCLRILSTLGLYLSEMSWPSSSEAGRRHLRSANRGQLVVPRYRLTTAGRRAFSCAGRTVYVTWNSLPEYLTVDMLTLDYFKGSLKCFLFARYWHSAWSALGICNDSAIYKCTLNNNNRPLIIIII